MVFFIPNKELLLELIHNNDSIDRIKVRHSYNKNQTNNDWSNYMELVSNLYNKN